MLPGVGKTFNGKRIACCVFPLRLGLGKSTTVLKSSSLLSMLSLSLLEPLKLRRQRCFKEQSDTGPSIVRRAGWSYQAAARPRILSFFGFAHATKANRGATADEAGIGKSCRWKWQRDEMALN